MPDQKISALASLGAGVDAADLVEVVDVSDTTMAASGTNKRVTVADVRGTGGVLYNFATLR